MKLKGGVCCEEDGGRPSAFGIQVQEANGLDAASVKSRCGERSGKRPYKNGHVGFGEMNESEPFDEASKVVKDVKTKG